MSKILFTFSLSLGICAMTAGSTWAAELVIKSGHAIRHPCDAPLASLLEEARADALAQLGQPSNFRRVSAWNDRAYETGWPYGPDICRYQGAWAYASFVDQSQLEEDWFVTTEGRYENWRTQWRPDSEAWNQALGAASQSAQFYCGGQIQGRPQIIEAVKNDFNGERGYSLFSMRVRFQCLKPIECDPHSPYQACDSL